MIWIYIIYSSVKLYNLVKSILIKLLSKNKFTKSIVENYGIRTGISSIISTLINLIYCSTLIYTALISGSTWLVCLTLYYIALTLTKSSVLVGSFGLIFNIKDGEYSKTKQIKTYRNCGIFLVLMSIAMSGMVVQMILMEADIKYSNFLIYVVAVYTFIRIMVSIAHTIKSHKTKNMILQALRNINLTSAVVSLFSLQVALINYFSNGSNPFVMNLITGISVSTLIVFLGIFMIVKGQQKLNENQLIFVYEE